MSGQSYTGADNLEAMAEAKNYNRFLVREVLRSGGGASSALDFGAGTGTFARAIREQGIQVTCVEPDDQLRHALESLGLPCHADLDHVPAASVDFVFSLNVLEHIENDRAAIETLHRCLKPGGRLFLYLPAFGMLYSSMDRKVGHYRRYRIGDLSHKLQRGGFVVQHARYVDSLGFFVTLLYRLLGNRRGDLNRRALAIHDRLIFPASRVLDRFLGRFLGKNLALLATRPRNSKPTISPQPAVRSAVRT